MHCALHTDVAATAAVPVPSVATNGGTGIGGLLRCVCGGRLDRIDGRTRAKRMVLSSYPMLGEDAFPTYLPDMDAVRKDRR